ncbi:MAG: translation initiation factor IF-3, partial [Planctomycetota bacterium]|nr:translation initiation factor IF-3 [Planctomycetota bacterium]
MTAEQRTRTIARRRYFRPDQNYNRGPRVNEQIRRSPVRLIDENDQMVGIVNIEDAMRRAREAGLDLVEVAADSDPPVCRIRDYGKFKYEQSKKDKASKARSKMAEMKEVRLGRSMKIDPHDVEIRMNQARRFLMEGHKVQIVQNFRGREMIHRERGSERMRDIIERLSDIAKLETPPRQTGKRLTMILAPDKSKIEQVKRREAAAKQKATEA